jgi:hypothetical protein
MFASPVIKFNRHNVIAAARTRAHERRASHARRNDEQRGRTPSSRAGQAVRVFLSSWCNNHKIRPTHNCGPKDRGKVEAQVSTTLRRAVKWPRRAGG